MRSYLPKYLRDLLLFGLVLLVFVAMPEDAFAKCVTKACTGNVFEQISCRASKFLCESKGIIFVLAGFGIIGFAFMAIFNKISWKWFANIAIGLLLVALMGLFIDYFTTRSGASGTYHTRLDYGYDMGNKTENPGTPGGTDKVNCKDNPELPGCEDDNCGEGMMIIGGKCVNPGSPSSSL